MQSSSLEDNIKKKLRRLQKLTHKALLSKTLARSKNKLTEVTHDILSSEIEGTDQHFFLKCSNCKIIFSGDCSASNSDLSANTTTFRSPFFNNNHFEMPISFMIYTENSTSFDGVMKHEYSNGIGVLYYLNKIALQLFLQSLSFTFQQIQESQTLSDDDVLKFSILSVLLPSSCLATSSVDEFFERQSKYFQCSTSIEY
ncbi:hypothetical protein FDP41_008975 [Naegleria fowleri]|uniref:Uncharacterized protein n=1 Tax=Naegleria fowleri TaxID=5763 RepID=A0A6A5BDF2_NAEFO|nr:uncharacterized protein FDP41_008975 [Naegleria fowleri]KAF0972726.1 hypothetical protein FDP41_008975 [Naegleria fowleri]CAG4708369.1 unnamed protein product [Naegleria fowleri]